MNSPMATIEPRRSDFCPHTTGFQTSVEKYLMNSFSPCIPESTEIERDGAEFGLVEKKDGTSLEAKTVEWSLMCSGFFLLFFTFHKEMWQNFKLV